MLSMHGLYNQLPAVQSKYRQLERDILAMEDRFRVRRQMEMERQMGLMKMEEFRGWRNEGIGRKRWDDDGNRFYSQFPDGELRVREEAIRRVIERGEIQAIEQDRLIVGMERERDRIREMINRQILHGSDHLVNRNQIHAYNHRQTDQAETFGNNTPINNKTTPQQSSHPKKIPFHSSTNPTNPNPNTPPLAEPPQPKFDSQRKVINDWYLKNQDRNQKRPISFMPKTSASYEMRSTAKQKGGNNEDKQKQWGRGTVVGNDKENGMGLKVGERKLGNVSERGMRGEWKRSMNRQLGGQQQERLHTFGTPNHREWIKRNKGYELYSPSNNSNNNNNSNTNRHRSIYSTEFPAKQLPINKQNTNPQQNALQKIKNRLKLSEIVYRDSKFKNMKHEEQHLMNTYQNEYKLRKEIKERINNHPYVMRRHGLV